MPPMFRRNLITIEARRLEGDAAETMDVINWIRNTGGLQWLIGNANEPETLVPEGGGKAGDPGIYLDPATGNLVIRSSNGDQRATYGDWIVLNSTGVFETMTHADFVATYDPA